MMDADTLERTIADGKCRVHDLKCWPVHFRAVVAGVKPFEVRDARDRTFMAGDVLRLREWCPVRRRFSGAATRRLVTYVLTGGQFGIARDHVVMGIEDMDP